MRRPAFKAVRLLPVALLVLTGCTHQYLLKLTNGDQLISYTRPKLEGTGYHFTDAAGAGYVIPKSRVVKIQSVRVVKDEPQPAVSQPKSPPGPKHWYFLWLA